MADCIPIHEPGGRLTAVTTGAVTGGRFCAISGDRQATLAINTSVTGGNYSVAHAAAGAWALGVAERDTASGAKVTLLTGSGMILPIVADGAMDEGDAVMVGTSGKAKKATAGNNVVGRCMTTVADAGTAEIRLGNEGIWILDT